MKISVIASGSNGNSCLIEDKETRVLIDAGKSMSEIEKRMNRLGKSLDNLDAVLITHRHLDHIQGAGPISRRYEVPVYLTKNVWQEAKGKLGKIKKKHFSPDKKFKINKLTFKPILTSHSVSSSGFVVGKFGLFTDTGKITPEMNAVFPKLKGVLLETNYNRDKLINGKYPPFLKRVISSDIGHLDNNDALSFIENRGKNLSFALLGHVSGNNNDPEIIKSGFEREVKRNIDYHICSRDHESGVWDL